MTRSTVPHQLSHVLYVRAPICALNTHGDIATALSYTFHRRLVRHRSRIRPHAAIDSLRAAQQLIVQGCLMRKCLPVLVVILFLCSSAARAGASKIKRHVGGIEGNYIVVLRNEMPIAAVDGLAKSLAASYDGRGSADVEIRLACVPVPRY